MVPHFLLLVTNLSLVRGLFGINLQNNVCPDFFRYYIAAISSKCSYNPDVLSDTISIAARHGYDAKSYSTVTNDGYILNLYRISSKSVTGTENPVLFLHGILINSESWVNTGNRSIAFNFADRGHDVWIGGIRGSIGSNKHVNLTVDDPEYWDYNLDTLSDEDVDAQVNLVANITGKKILIVGYSMGTTISFMYASTHYQRAAQLVEGIVALAPVAYLNDVAWIEFITPLATLAIDLFDILKIRSLYNHEDVFHQIQVQSCKVIPYYWRFLFKTISADDIPLLLSICPSATSIFELQQYLQIAASDRFQKYDYGESGNEKMYGASEPPTYNLTNIQVPIFLFYGKNDVFYKIENQERLYNELGSVRKYEFAVPTNTNNATPFNHLDFLYSKKIIEYLYEEIFNVLDLNLN